MKKIALDLDGVVFDSENLYRVYTEMYDVDVFKKDSLVDNTKRIFQQRYDWPQKEFGKFYRENAKKILSTCPMMTGSEIVLPKLNQYFHFIVVTSRSDEEVEYAREKLSNIGLNVTIFSNEHDKIDRLIKEKVDYIIDDDESICKNASLHNIYALYFKNNASDPIEENQYLKNIHNWGEIYKYLMISSEENEF